MSSVTIRDIARAANVSVATVSRTLNDKSCVTDEMRERVLSTAEKLGYVPNSAAKTLKTNSTHTIGVMVSDISNPDYISIIRTMEDIVQARQYSLMLCSTGDRQDREQDCLQMLLSRNVDGLVLNTTELNNDLVIRMSQRIPTLLINRSIRDDRFRGDLITTNSYQGIYQLTRQLVSMGHRRIYAIQGPDHLSNSQERFRAFQDAMAQEAGITVDTGEYPYLFSGAYSRQTGAEAVRRMRSFAEPPTAVLSFSNIAMLGVLHELIAAGIRIPEELTLASYDSLPDMELLSIRPLTAQFDNAAIGDRCARSLLERIEEPGLANRSFLFEPTLIFGNALGFPKG